MGFQMRQSKSMNDMPEEEYVRGGESYCPYCRQKSTEVNDNFSEGAGTNTIESEVCCTECHCRWTSVFQLVGWS